MVKHALLSDIFIAEVKDPHLYDCPVMLYIKWNIHSKYLKNSVIDLMNKQLGNDRLLLATFKSKECFKSILICEIGFPVAHGLFFASHIFLALAQVLILEIRDRLY